MLRKLEDLSPTDWIKGNTDSVETSEARWNGNFVSHCVPKIYPAYCKILHPIYEDLSITDRDLSWNDVKMPRDDRNDAVNNLLNEATTVYGGEFDSAALRRISWRSLAERCGLVFHPELDSWSFSRHFRGGSWPRYLIGPDEGSLELPTCAAIVETLTPFTGNETCYFLYDLITTDDYQSDLLFCGSLADVFAARDVENVHASPTRWWPESRSWFVHTDYDLTFTLVGGPGAVIETLIANPTLDCIEVRDDHRIDYLADRVNP